MNETVEGFLCGSEFRKNGFCSGDRIWGLKDRAADDDEVGAAFGCFARGHDTRLVVEAGVAWADSRGDQIDVGREDIAEWGDFVRGAYEPLHAGFGGECAEAGDLFGGRVGHTDEAKIVFAHGGENGHAQEEQVGGVLTLGLDGPLHHLAAAAGVECEHADGQFGGGLHGLGDRIGDVMKLQVEEDVEAQVCDFADAIGSAGGVHFEADFGPADGTREAFQGRGDGTGRLCVENEDQVAGHRKEC